MEGFSLTVLETIWNRTPSCFTHLKDLTISLTPDVKMLLLLLKLAANSPLRRIRIHTESRLEPDRHPCLSQILEPLHSTTSLMHLKLEFHPRKPSFWSSLVQSWKGLTDIHMELEESGQELYNVAAVLDSLSSLPLLSNLKISSVNDAKDLRPEYIFVNLQSLQVYFFNEPTDLIGRLRAPHLSLIHVIFLGPIDEPTWSNMFTMIDQCNPTQTLLTIAMEMERHWDAALEIPEELSRGESFNEDTFRPLYVFHRLQSLEIRPGLSCHLLTNEFYEILPMHWPMLETFHLGGHLIWSSTYPVATLKAIVAILDGCHHIRHLCIPHIRGWPLPDTGKIYGTIESIGNIFGEYITLWSYLEWTTTFLPSVTNISTALSSYDDQARKCEILSNEFQPDIRFNSVAVWYVDCVLVSHDDIQLWADRIGDNEE